MKKIKWEDIKDGSRIKIIGTYWRSASDSQEEVTIVTIKSNKGVKSCFMENGKKFYHGINSTYEYFLIEN